MTPPIKLYLWKSFIYNMFVKKKNAEFPNATETVRYFAQQPFKTSWTKIIFPNECP